MKITKPIQYLLVGLPFSGKTTLALELKKRLNFASINVDKLKWSMGYRDVGDDEVPDKVWKDIFRQADQLIVKYLREGKNLASEYAWVTKSWRDRARDVAGRAGFTTKIIYLKIPIAEIKRRLAENRRLKNHFIWPEKELNNYIKDFEEPGDDEDVIIYDQTILLDRWITENII